MVRRIARFQEMGIHPAGFFHDTYSFSVCIQGKGFYGNALQHVFGVLVGINHRRKRISREANDDSLPGLIVFWDFSFFQGGSVSRRNGF